MPDADPLTDADLETMKEGIKRLDEADNLIKKSMAAGIDMKTQQERSREARTQITRIRQTFFPGR